MSVPQTLQTRLPFARMDPIAAQWRVHILAGCLDLIDLFAACLGEVAGNGPIKGMLVTLILCLSPQESTLLLKKVA